MDVLVIGGTRNLGPLLVRRLLDGGRRIAVLNRGVTPDDLSADVERLRADRADPAQLSAALRGRRFDAVVDLTLYDGAQAHAAVDLLNGVAGHYIFVSTGQVYLVRGDLHRPFRESDYDGPVMPAPTTGPYDVDEWRYGVDKRAAEDVLAEAGAIRGFPYTTLRLPMVNGERDHFFRLYGYMLRLQDGGPILVPRTPAHALRHVYSGDVVEAIVTLLGMGARRRAYNVSQEETVTLPELLERVAGRVGVPLRLVEVERAALDAHGLLPDASPFSDNWMSELDNSLGKRELGLRYTPLDVYVDRTIASYQAAPPPVPDGYRRRALEKGLAAEAR